MTDTLVDVGCDVARASDQIYLNFVWLLAVCPSLVSTFLGLWLRINAVAAAVLLLT